VKRIGITQRVEQIPNYSERRDCLDQRWSVFVWELECIPIPLPNCSPSQVPHLLDELQLDAVILSGGNSIASLDNSATDAAPERDAFESILLNEALERNLPIIGVCRGMQMINVHMGGKLTQISGHVAVRHRISPIDQSYFLPESVNSYHNWGISADDLAEELQAIAFDSEGKVEALNHTKKKLFGIMWHPEREQPFNSLDIELIKRFLL
jgi:N5-(cytidine 5'-diphosphoramidyl)-L-glutamine hydrolase